MTAIFKKYAFALFIGLSLGLLSIFDPSIGQKACLFAGRTLVSFLLSIPPVFVWMGLLDVWVDREYMVRAVGENSGIRGVLIAYLFGVITAVPLYALLPIAGVLLKKGCRLSNALIFVCSCASIRIPLLLFEASSLGWKFTLTRGLCNVVIVILIAFIIEGMVSEREREEIYHSAVL